MWWIEAWYILQYMLNDFGFKSKLERLKQNVHHKHENSPRARVTIDDDAFANLYDDLPTVEDLWFSLTTQFTQFTLTAKSLQINKYTLMNVNALICLGRRRRL